MKMKKMLSWLLVLVLCIGVLPMSVMAAGEFSATKGGVTISVEKSQFDPRETITVTVTGFTQAMVDASCIVGLYEANATGNHEYEDYETVSGDDPCVLDFTAPGNKTGQYELRFRSEFYPKDEATLLTVVLPITVGEVVAAGNVTLDKDAYKAGETMTVTVTGVTEQMVTADAFIAVYTKGAEHTSGGNTGNNAAYTKLTQTGDSTHALEVPNMNGEFEVRLYSNGWDVRAETLIASASFTISGAMDSSDWALTELQQADELGLIPDILQGADLTQSITRAEFAAVSVKAYEKLSGVSAIPAINNPFTDTTDVEVLKAYNTGITSGISADKFDPTALLNREQAATMLTRVFKKVSLSGWTLATDSNFTLPYEKPAAFADDKDISDWARDSVYFMAANKIIAGVGDNKFAPKNVTTEDEATGYANATREQALIIAVRMVENLK